MSSNASTTTRRSPRSSSNRRISGGFGPARKKTPAANMPQGSFSDACPFQPELSPELQPKPCPPGAVQSRPRRAPDTALTPDTMQPQTAYSPRPRGTSGRRTDRGPKGYLSRFSRFSRFSRPGRPVSRPSRPSRPSRFSLSRSPRVRLRTYSVGRHPTCFLKLVAK